MSDDLTPIETLTRRLKALEALVATILPGPPVERDEPEPSLTKLAYLSQFSLQDCKGQDKLFRDNGPANQRDCVFLLTLARAAKDELAAARAEVERLTKECGELRGMFLGLGHGSEILLETMNAISQFLNRPTRSNSMQDPDTSHLKTNAAPEPLPGTEIDRIIDPELDICDKCPGTASRYVDGLKLCDGCAAALAARAELSAARAELAEATARADQAEHARDCARQHASSLANEVHELKHRLSAARAELAEATARLANYDEFRAIINDTSLSSYERGKKLLDYYNQPSPSPAAEPAIDMEAALRLDCEWDCCKAPDCSPDDAPEGCIYDPARHAPAAEPTNMSNQPCTRRYKVENPNKPYPRSCPRCGVFGPCVDPEYKSEGERWKAACDARHEAYEASKVASPAEPGPIDALRDRYSPEIMDDEPPAAEEPRPTCECPRRLPKYEPQKPERDDGYLNGGGV